jgi:hypothetical protein
MPFSRGCRNRNQVQEISAQPHYGWTGWFVRKGLEGCGAATAFDRITVKRWGPERVSAHPIRNVLLRIYDRSALANAFAFASAMRPSIRQGCLGCAHQAMHSMSTMHRMVLSPQSPVFAEQKMRPNEIVKTS